MCSKNGSSISSLLNVQQSYGLTNEAVTEPGCSAPHTAEPPTGVQQ